MMNKKSEQGRSKAFKPMNENSTKQKKVNLKNETVCSAMTQEGFYEKYDTESTHKRRLRRNTIQYKLVLDAMLSMKHAHPSAPEIHKEIAKTYPGISIATVYSQMRRLEENGVIRVISCLGSADRFDAILDEHSHIKCEECGAVSDLIIELPKGLNERAAKASGYLVNGNNIIFSGVCPNCRKANEPESNGFCQT